MNNSMYSIHYQKNVIFMRHMHKQYKIIAELGK